MKSQQEVCFKIQLPIAPSQPHPKYEDQLTPKIKTTSPKKKTASPRKLRLSQPKKQSHTKYEDKIFWAYTKFAATLLKSHLFRFLWPLPGGQGHHNFNISVCLFYHPFFAWRRQTSYNVARPLLMAPLDCWWIATPKFGKATFCTMKTDKVRAHKKI